MVAAVETMAFAGQVPWHGLGTPLVEEDYYDWHKTCEKAGLNWEVEKVPMVTADTLSEVPGRFAVRRKSDASILGTVGARYHLLQNSKAFEWFSPFLQAREAALHTAGSLFSGSRIWVLAKLNRDPLEIVPGDTVEKYLLLSHSHDGTLSVRVGFTPVRVVCANTLAMAHGDKASKLIRLKHSSTLERNMEAVRDVMNLANQEFEATAEQYRLLARKDISQVDLTNYVKRVLKVDEATVDADLATRTKNTIEDVIQRCLAGRGNDITGVRGTLWGAYNGVTEYLAYKKGHNAENRLDNLWFGSGAEQNRLALEVALAMAV